VRLGLAAQLFADELWVVDARARLDVLGHLEGAVGPGDDDLALHFEADAHFMTTSVLLATWSSDPGEPRPRDPELGRRLESHVRAAHELFADKPKTVRRTYSFVSRSFQTIAWARELQGLEDEAIAVWEEGAAAVVLEAEPAGGEKKTFFVPVENDEELWNHNTDLSRLCERQALALERFKRYEDAERAFERAVAAQSASAVGMPWGPTQHFAWFLLRRSRNSEALAVCLEGFPRGYRNAALTGLTAELLSEAGDEKLKAFLDEGLRELPRNPTLTDLRSRFFPSDPR
jgi:hypothetical protein